MERRTWHWIFAIAASVFVFLSVYCALVFRDLRQLMSQAPESKPSVIYSDAYVLRVGSIYIEQFIEERLALGGTKFELGEGEVHWTAPPLSVPDQILDLLKPDSAVKSIKPGTQVDVYSESGRISQIKLSGESVESILIPPEPVAHLAGAQTSLRDYLKLYDVPSKLVQAIMAIEDQRFLEHSGFDPKSLARALWVNIKNRSLAQGGSTLTQQLVKNLLGARQKTLFRKFRELILAILMELTYSKEQILEKYLNEIYFGQVGTLEVHGVSEASRFFFGKQLAELNLGELALIAGIIRGPAVYSPFRHLSRTLERKNVVLKKMLERDLLSPLEFQAATRDPIRLVNTASISNRAPYFVDFAKAQILEELGERLNNEDLSTQGLRVISTRDPAIQTRADAAVLSGVRAAESKHKTAGTGRIEGILVSASPENGAIRAIVGGRSYSETTYNRALNMKRQVGSIFKPIVVLAALAEGRDEQGRRYTAASVVEDQPWTYRYENNQSWSPRNYEKKFEGQVSLRHILAHSINIPTAKVGLNTGLEPIIRTAAALGVRTPLKAVPSLTLGSIELSPIEVLEVYSTLASSGKRSPLTSVQIIADHQWKVIARNQAPPEQVAHEDVVGLLNELLAEVVKTGTARSMPNLGYSKPTFGKTGTTSFYRDAWFSGYSQGLATTVWIGYDELKNAESSERLNEKLKLTGSGAALPVWTQFYSKVRPSPLIDPDPDYTKDLIRASIDPATGLLAGPHCARSPTDEFFVRGTEPTTTCNNH